MGTLISRTEAAAPLDVARLTALLKKGDEEAYRQFFGLYFHRLLSYLLAVTHGNEVLARELVQQTMLRVARHVRVFDDEAVFWRWLTVLARTAAVDEGRKAHRYCSVLERWWSGRHKTPFVEIQDQTEAILAAGFEQLDSDERILLEKKYLDECTVRDIAADLGLSDKAVESRLTRARLKLKQLMLEGMKNA